MSRNSKSVSRQLVEMGIGCTKIIVILHYTESAKRKIVTELAGKIFYRGQAVQVLMLEIFWDKRRGRYTIKINGMKIIRKDIEEEWKIWEGKEDRKVRKSTSM